MAAIRRKMALVAPALPKSGTASPPAQLPHATPDIVSNQSPKDTTEADADTDDTTADKSKKSKFG